MFWNYYFISNSDLIFIKFYFQEVIELPFYNWQEVEKLTE